jgi:Mg-chelatase subunit ChlI
MYKWLNRKTHGYGTPCFKSACQRNGKAAAGFRGATRVGKDATVEEALKLVEKRRESKKPVHYETEKFVSNPAIRKQLAQSMEDFNRSVTVYTPEMIEAIKHTITPIDKIRQRYTETPSLGR